jgi:hypothetical protein
MHGRSKSNFGATASGIGRAAIAAMHVSYVLPLRCPAPVARELDNYLRWLSRHVELIVVDGSPASIFVAHAERWSTIPMSHLDVDPDLRGCANGKVAGVLTGVRRASYDLLIVADDDVRYGAESLAAVASALEDADIVRPQNYFDPLPWHAWVDTGRSLLNRVSGGDWPGTLGVRRSTLIAARGYDGDVLFENLELVRTIVAAGGRERSAPAIYVRRLPPSTRHFWSQRVRQAYDEFARPHRLLMWLLLVPAIAAALVAGIPSALAVAVLAVIAAAEAGRRRAGGARVFPAVASFAAPLWVCERAICAWLALGAFVLWGGIPYRGQIIARAATPMRVLQQRFRKA